MPLLNSKRQITIPKNLCEHLQIQPGDEFDIVAHKGRVTLIKKQKGASRGVLSHLKANNRTRMKTHWPKEKSRKIGRRNQK